MHRKTGRYIKAFLCCLTAVSISVLSMPVKAAYVNLDDEGGGIYNVKTRTFLDNRYYHVYRQRFDFSCGSAALASLLTYNYNHPITEDRVIKAMYSAGDKAKINREGFSLLDMKNYLKTMHLEANGYRASLDDLAETGIPAIVLINRNGYMHFVIVQGVTKDKVLLGDPALGKKIMARKAFEDMWKNGILFVIENDTDYAKKTFNTEWAWHSKHPGKFFMPIPNSDLSALSLMTSYTPNSFH